MGELLIVIVIAAVVFGPMLLAARHGHGRTPEAGRSTGLSTQRTEPMGVMPLVKAVVAGGVVANVLDTVAHGFVLGDAYYSRQTGLFATGSVAWFVLGNFVAVGVFVWVYLRVRQSFRYGARGGATFGLYAGVLIGFPTHIVLSLIIVDFPYGLAWAWTIHEVVWTVTVGAIIGLLVGGTESRPVAAVR